MQTFPFSPETLRVVDVNSWRYAILCSNTQGALLALRRIKLFANRHIYGRSERTILDWLTRLMGVQGSTYALLYPRQRRRRQWVALVLPDEELRYMSQKAVLANHEIKGQEESL